MTPRTALVRDADLLADPVVAGLLAHVPGVQVRIDEHLGVGAYASREDDGSNPRVTLGATLVYDRPRPHLCGVLAHEVAHHVLGHTAGGKARSAGYAIIAAATLPVPVAAAYLLGLGAQEWAAGLLLVFALLRLLLVVCWAQRQELAADVRSVALLEEAGLPGRETAVAMLQTCEKESLPVRLTAWAWSTHPTTARRIRAVRKAPCTTC